MRMDIKEIRVANLNFWADKLGRGILAEKLGYPDTNYLNQLCTGNGSFGNRTAKKIEKRLQLENGWMDRVHTIVSYPSGETHQSPVDATSGKQIIEDITQGFTETDFQELAIQADVIRRRKIGAL